MPAVRSLHCALSAAAAALGWAARASSTTIPQAAEASTADAVLLITMLAAIGVAVLLAYRAWSEARRFDGGDDDEDVLPPLVFPQRTAETFVGKARRPARSQAQAEAGMLQATTTQRPLTTRGAEVTRPRPSGRAPAPAAGPATGRGARSQARPEAVTTHVPDGGNGSATAALREADEAPAGDTTLQILPGRLEVLSGDAGMQEIRFVRGAAGEPLVTLGRSTGSPPEHVQLRSPAVSRLHARMRFDGGRWYVTNLSRTNPALVNGTSLSNEGEERLLQDGDQLELGDVVLRFRTR